MQVQHAVAGKQVTTVAHLNKMVTEASKAFVSLGHVLQSLGESDVLQVPNASTASAR